MFSNSLLSTPEEGMSYIVSHMLGVCLVSCFFIIILKPINVCLEFCVLGKLVFFSEGLLIVHPSYGIITLSKNHIRNIKVYDGVSIYFKHEPKCYLLVY